MSSERNDTNQQMPTGIPTHMEKKKSRSQIRQKRINLLLHRCRYWCHGESHQLDQTNLQGNSKEPNRELHVARPTRQEKANKYCANSTKETFVPNICSLHTFFINATLIFQGQSFLKSQMKCSSQFIFSQQLPCSG